MGIKIRARFSKFVFSPLVNKHTQQDVLSTSLSRAAALHTWWMFENCLKITRSPKTCKTTSNVNSEGPLHKVRRVEQLYRLRLQHNHRAKTSKRLKKTEEEDEAEETIA